MSSLTHSGLIQPFFTECVILLFVCCYISLSCLISLGLKSQIFDLFKYLKTADCFTLFRPVAPSDISLVIWVWEQYWNTKVSEWKQHHWFKFFTLSYSSHFRRVEHVHLLSALKANVDFDNCTHSSVKWTKWMFLFVCLPAMVNACIEVAFFFS